MLVLEPLTLSPGPQLPYPWALAKTLKSITLTAWLKQYYSTSTYCICNLHVSTDFITDYYKQCQNKLKLNIYVVSHIESGHEYEYQLDHTIIIKQSWDVGQFIGLGAYEQQHFVITYLSIYAMAKPT